VSGIIRELWHSYCWLYVRRMKGTSPGKEGKKFELRILISLPLHFLLGTVLGRKIEVRIYKIDNFF